MSDVMTNAARAELHQKLAKAFSTEELNELCFDFQVADDEDVLGSAEKKGDYIRNIVRYAELSGRVGALTAQLKKSRSALDWDFALVGLKHEGGPGGTIDGKTALVRLKDEIEARKRTIRIFNITVPAVPVLIGCAAFIVIVAFGVWFAVTPTTMAGGFNIAVAQFGEEDAQGNVKPSASGDQLSALVFEQLSVSLKDLPANLPKPLIWHDSLGWLQKRTQIGTLINEQEAIRRAKEIGADVLIYGNLKAKQSPAGFVPKFVVTQSLSNTDELDQIKGSHQLGDAIAVPMPLDLKGNAVARTSLMGQLGKRMSLLAQLTIGLLYDLAGDSETAASVFEGATKLKFGTPDGAEVLYYFLGKQYLFVTPRRLDDAQAAFEQALALKPSYARARVGLGSTCFYRAQLIKPPDKRLDNGLLQQCIDTYQQALDEAHASSEQTVETQALMGLGAAQRLAAEAYVFAGDYDAAASLFLGAAGSLSSAQPFIGKEEHRLMGMLHENLGDVYLEQGDVKLRQANAAVAASDSAGASRLYAESKALFEQAIQRYQACGDAAVAGSVDLFLKSRVYEGLCIPHQKRAKDLLESVQKIK